MKRFSAVESANADEWESIVAILGSSTLHSHKRLVEAADRCSKQEFGLKPHSDDPIQLGLPVLEVPTDFLKRPGRLSSKRQGQSDFVLTKKLGEAIIAWYETIPNEGRCLTES